LSVFWKSHDPYASTWLRQYANIIFYNTEQQRKLALASREGILNGSVKMVQTEILPYSEFYLAEDYHQKFYLQQVPELLKEFKAIYPKTIDFINSTAAARINGYLGGFGTLDTLQKEINGFGLSTLGNKKLLELAGIELGASCPLPP
jgi:peptide-methionine (S)-S-oxide reductase